MTTPLFPTRRMALCLPILALLSGCGAPMTTATVAEVAAPVAEAMGDSVSAKSRGGVGAPRSGVVTAGDIDDARNLGSFQRYQSRQAKTLGLPTLALRDPLAVQVTGGDGRPAPGMAYTLRKPGAADPFHSGHTGVDGQITAFPGVLAGRRLDKVELRLFGEGQQEHRVTLATGADRHSVAVSFTAGWAPKFLDLVFVVDATGSMGDEIAWLSQELQSVVASARGAAPGVDIRYGLVAYRDEGDDFVVKSYGFTKNGPDMAGWLQNLRADGGGDYPEAAERGLAAAAAMDWRRGAGERLLFHIADAPPHSQKARAFLQAATRLAQKGVQVFGLGASGAGPEVELTMRQAALATEGRYLFLTDDSGVGNAHAEPTIACYRVTALKSLMIRVMQSELSGRRVEAREQEILREVGSYRNGVCAQ